MHGEQREVQVLAGSADQAAHLVKRATRGRASQVPDRRIAQHHWILHTRRSITAQLTRLGFVDVVAEPRLRYTLTSEAYIASMNPSSWSIRPASPETITTAGRAIPAAWR